MLLFLLVLVILAAGAGASVYYLTNLPKAKRRPPRPQATLVEVSPVSLVTESVVVQALGTVVPAQTIQLASRVSGEVVKVSGELAPGGHFDANEQILQVEPEDYRLAVEQRASDLARAQSALRLEMGQQSVARREYELLGQDVREEDRELLMRQPQLATAKATVAAAEASLAKAKLDLKRTDVVAPFNATVQSRSVDLGSQVAVGASLASLVGTDKYWVQVSIPVSQLKWIRVPGANDETGSAARVYHEAAWGSGTFRVGKVERLMTDLEPQGRMVRLLVAVQDPMELKAAPADRHPLILGSYVRVEIDGRDLPKVARVPRTALRDGEAVWVMRADKGLEIRQVSIAWSGNEHVCVIEGLRDGDLLITSDLPAAVAGMALRTADEAEGRPSKRLASGPEDRKDPEARQ